LSIQKKKKSGKAENKKKKQSKEALLLRNLINEQKNEQNYFSFVRPPVRGK
jgi:hypothetical protein